MEPFKNLFDEKFVKSFANNIRLYDDTFKEDEYVQAVLKELHSLELKQRMRLISSCLHPHLSLSYKKSIDVLKKVKQHFTYEESMGLQAMVLQDYVEVYGLNDFELSMQALEFFTIESSSEFAIRHFIIKYENRCMQQLKEWSKSENEHIRRLCSEGCRPRLPWAIALPTFKKNPSKVMQILEILKHDESEYVRKSVANNLNDISKDNPATVIEFLQKNLGFSKNLDWICKHGSRTLLKAGHKETLELFGYKRDNAINIENLTLDKSVCMGEKLHFSFDVNTTKQSIGNLRLEYAIDFMKANAKLARKIFMISQSCVKKKNKHIEKYHNFKEITTRKYYKGLHKIAIIVNGEEKIIKEFEVK